MRPVPPGFAGGQGLGTEGSGRSPRRESPAGHRLGPAPHGSLATRVSFPTPEGDSARTVTWVHGVLAPWAASDAAAMTVPGWVAHRACCGPAGAKPRSRQPGSCPSTGRHHSVSPSSTKIESPTCNAMRLPAAGRPPMEIGTSSPVTGSHISALGPAMGTPVPDDCALHETCPVADGTVPAAGDVPAEAVAAGCTAPAVDACAVTDGAARGVAGEEPSWVTTIAATAAITTSTAAITSGRRDRRAGAAA